MLPQTSLNSTATLAPSLPSSLVPPPPPPAQHHP
ncbi:unnamed protein product, partial [Rotaria sp. Silwood1]